MRYFLGFPAVYRAAMWALRDNTSYAWFIKDILAISAGEKVIDIGCGPADILTDLPGVQYFGVDISEAYIAAARKRYGSQGQFFSGNVREWRRNPIFQNADIVFCNGVLHHADDAEALDLLRFGRDSLRPTGRFVFYEPCYLARQSRLSAFFMSLDRGQHIRSEVGWKKLISQVFTDYDTQIVTAVNRLGYIGIVGCARTHTACDDWPPAL